MKGQEILQSVLGKKLQSGIVQSFYFNNELVDIINLTYLKFDNKWIRIFTTDDITSIQLEENNIEEIIIVGDDIVKYSIQPIKNIFPNFNKYLNKELLYFKELVSKKYHEISFGVNLYFEDNSNFIIRNIDYPIDRNVYHFEKTMFDDLIEI